MHAAGWRGSAARARSGLLTTSRPGCTPWRAGASTLRGACASIITLIGETFLSACCSAFNRRLTLRPWGVGLAGAHRCLHPNCTTLAADDDSPFSQVKLTSMQPLTLQCSLCWQRGWCKGNRRAAPAAAAWPPQTAGRAASHRFHCWGLGMPGRRPARAPPRAAARARSRPRRTPQPRLGAPRGA